MERDGSLEKLIADAVAGDEVALKQLLTRVYDEIRRVAHHLMNGQPPGHTLQATALMHEAFVNVLDGKLPAWQSEKHFLNSIPEIMRNVLVSHHRRKEAKKRKPPGEREPLNPNLPAKGPAIPDVLALDEVLTQLAESHELAARVFVMHYFGVMTIEETSVVLDLSIGEIRREWERAKKWLKEHL